MTEPTDEEIAEKRKAMTPDTIEALDAARHALFRLSTELEAKPGMGIYMTSAPALRAMEEAEAAVRRYQNDPLVEDELCTYGCGSVAVPGAFVPGTCGESGCADLARQEHEHRNEI